MSLEAFTHFCYTRLHFYDRQTLPESFGNGSTATQTAASPAHCHRQLTGMAAEFQQVRSFCPLRVTFAIVLHSSSWQTSVEKPSKNANRSSSRSLLINFCWASRNWQWRNAQTGSVWRSIPHRVDALSRWPPRNAHSMPLGDDRCGKLNFGQNGIMFVFYMGLPHMYFISTYIGFMS